MKKNRIGRIPSELDKYVKERATTFNSKPIEEMRNIASIHNYLSKELNIDLSKIAVVKTKDGRKPVFPNIRLFRIK